MRKLLPSRSRVLLLGTSLILALAPVLPALAEGDVSLGGTNPNSPPFITNEQVVAKTIHMMVNDYRKEQGRSPLRLDATLNDIAMRASRDTAEQKQYIGASNFVLHWAEVKKVHGNVINYAENYGMAWPDVNVAGKMLQRWMNEQRFNRNLMYPDWNLTGIGVATGPQGEQYITQVFAYTARPRDPKEMQDSKSITPRGMTMITTQVPAPLQ